MKKKKKKIVVGSLLIWDGTFNHEIHVALMAPAGTHARWDLRSSWRTIMIADDREARWTDWVHDSEIKNAGWWVLT